MVWQKAKSSVVDDGSGERVPEVLLFLLLLKNALVGGAFHACHFP